MRFLSSRKASVELSLKQIIGFILAVAIILATLSLFIGLMNIFVGPPESGSIATFDIAYKTVKAFYDPRNKNTSCYLPNVYVESDWAIIGFNADGIRAADSNIHCSIDEDCIEELCGRTDDNLVKPSSCGKGPCLCLCNGGYGDVKEDDCKETRASCNKFPQDIGFDVMYFVDPDSGNDGCQDNPYKVPGGDMDSLCDLVYYGHDCSWVGQGDERDVDYSLIIFKEQARANAESKTGQAVAFDLVPNEKRTILYPAVNVNCRDMVRDLQGSVVVEKPQEEAGPQSDKLQKELEQTKEQGIHSAKGGQ